MSGKSKVRGGRKMCSDADHVGDPNLLLSAFAADQSQPSGRRSKCRDCYNRWQNARRDAGDSNRRSAESRAQSAAKRDLAEAAALDKLESEARARQARLDSDFLPLRHDDFASESDDFDTSVANEPQSKGASKQASAEKRQEYAAAMGRHMSAVRGAAVAEERGGSMLEAMPGESGDYVGKLAEQERRFGNRRLARSISLFAAGEEQARRLWQMACRQYLTGRVTPTGYAAKPSTRRIKRSVCLLLSDLHLGADLGASENPIAFGATEEARRLEYVMRQTIDYKPQYRADSELVLMLNGDMIEGMLLHDFRDGAPLTEQKVVFQRYFERFVGECARTFPKVRVFCQPGNHGRDKLRHPGRATSSKWDGVEWGLYYALSRACAHLKNVTFDVPFRAITAIDLHGSWFGLTHADTEVKIGPPDTKSAANAQVLAEINSTLLYGVEFAAWGFGHHHTPRYLPKKIRVIHNGALIPPNGHARTSGYIAESCGQFLWEAVEGYPIGDVRFIEVGRAQDNDERLGTIIQPFRFDLT